MGAASQRMGLKVTPMSAENRAKTIISNPHSATIGRSPLRRNVLEVTNDRCVMVGARDVKRYGTGVPCDESLKYWRRVPIERVWN
jgi:hypothetical protein